jgi:hypothetical protein
MVNGGDASAFGERGRYDDLAQRAGGAGHDNDLSFHGGISSAGTVFAGHNGHVKSVGNAAKTLRRNTFSRRKCL